VYYYYEPEVDRMSDDQDGCEWVNVSSGSGLPLSRSSLVFLLVILLLTLTKMLKMQTHLDGHFSSEVVEDCFGFLLAELQTGRILR